MLEVKLEVEVNFLKTEIILFGQPDLLDGYDSPLGPLASYSHFSVRNLGVIFESSFNLKNREAQLSKQSFFI